METNEGEDITPKADRKKTMMKKKNIGLINQELLKLVARGSAVICEILRLKDYIPEPYSNKNEEKLYKDIIHDFSIFKPEVLDKFEAKLRTDPELLNKDEDFRVNNIEIIERFFSLFDSIYQYIQDWKTFIDQVTLGKFVQHTIDSILSNKELRPLFCESVFNAGVMLLLVDRLIPGPTREKLIVSYYRYKGQSTIPHFQDIYKLFASTGYFPPTSFSDPKDEVKPKKYPVDFFKRCDLNEEIIQKIIGTITGNDIYDHQLAYPTSNEYQTVAFSQQASLLVINLFFCPRMLEKDKKNMFDIVSKHFHDNFVISFYMGYTIDINEYWKEFKEAHSALEFNMKSSTLKDKKNNNLRKIKELDNRIKDYLNEGVMTEEYVLNNIEALLNIMRDSNVVLRWFILQRNITKKNIREIFNEKLENKDLVNLLLNLSQFEYLLKTMFQNLVFNKQTMWENDRNTCIQKLNELVSYYNGNTAFNNNVKLENYSKYFEDLTGKINGLDTKNPTKVGVKIGKIKDMITGIKSLDKISESVIAKENLRLINERLDHMLMLVNVKKNYLVSISKISDFSYAWINIHDYKDEMQRLLRKDSKNVLLLRATFLKLASILNIPLVRLFEIDSDDIESVTNYYSGELVKFVKTILQVIPRRVFELMKDVFNIFESGFTEMSLKILKKDFKNYARTEERYNLAKAVHGISMITKGIFMMEKTLMGVIEVDPKEILEEGIRKELLKKLAETFQKHIDFAPGDKIDLTQTLNKLIYEMSAIKKSFIYIQDYVNMNGSRMWSEEMHRLINFYVDLEANKFLSRKIKHKKDKYEIFKYKIPTFQPLKNSPESFTFLGRLVRYILNLTEPKNITFCPLNYTWYEKDKLDKEVFGIKTLYKIKKALGVEGFQGFGRLLGYLNFQNLVRLQPLFNAKLLNESSSTLRVINKQFGSPFITHYVEKAQGKELCHTLNKFSQKGIDLVMEKVLKIGQIEFLRKLQNYILNENSEVDCYLLNTELKSLDKINLLILKNDIKVNFINDDANPQQGELGKEPENKKESSLDNYYNNLCSFLEDFGYVDTEHTFFQNLNTLNYMPVILAATTFNSIKHYFEYDKKKMVLQKKLGENFDMNYYTHGVYCILYQMGKKHLITFIAMLSEILRIKLFKSKKKEKEKKGDTKDSKKKKESSSSGDGNPDITKHVSLLQFVLQELADNAGISLDLFEINLNNYLMFKNVATYYKIEPPKKKKK